MQHFEHVVQFGLVAAGGSLYLFDQEAEKRNFQFCRQPSILAVGDQPSGSTKGAAKGHVLVKGLWAVHPDRPFAPNQSLKVPGMTKLLPVFPWFVSLGQHCWVADILCFLGCRPG